MSIIEEYSFTQTFHLGDDAEEIRKLIDDKTKAIYIETIGNPRYNVPDFEAVAKVAREAGVPLVVGVLMHVRIQPGG